MAIEREYRRPDSLHPSRTLRPKVLEVEEIPTNLWVVSVEYKFCDGRCLVNGYIDGSVVVGCTFLAI
jgi:hypothetical protein